MKKFTSKAIVTLVAAGLMSSTVFSADFKFKFQSSDPAGVKNFELQQDWADRVEKMSGGRIDIDLLPTGAVVKHTETMDAMKLGILDGHITSTSYFAGKDPAFALLGGTVGAWSDTTQLLQFMNFGGGNELMEELYAPYGVQFIAASTTGLEAFVSKVPLNGVADLKGLKMRAPEGMVQKVFAAAGASPVNLPGSEVFTGLSKGVIDAADYTVFSTNHAQGMHDVAQHPVYPGFHSLPLIDISMSSKKWNKLPEDLREILKVASRDFSYNITNELKMADAVAVSEARANPSITIHDWSAEERMKFRAIAKTEWEKAAKASPSAEKAYKVLIEYMETSGLL
ncbi:TRAP transporter substrate-binding protein [Reinekea marina]|uniref:TRAP transporter substrate-binding protein n=1 Tax=Reinekea marina TaxID=1310421 RepID=A0ABV7WP95_9GAMM|nr:TRAP transporter substrate-binding protein [Reinekea marina]MDN3648675.1 TRAP transporter substrate-binding protein [Reinekea marina]